MYTRDIVTWTFKRNERRHPGWGRGPLMALVVLVLAGFFSDVSAVPMVLHFQGHVIRDGVAAEGEGRFKFVLLDDQGASVWSNDGTSVAGAEPVASVTFPLRRGVYSARLGDVSLPGMSAISPDAFAAEGLFLRVWFEDGGTFKQLSPDQEIGAVAYAARAGVADTVSSLPDDIVTMSHLAGELRETLLELQDRVAQLDEQVNSIAGPALTAASTDPSDPFLLELGYVNFTTLNERSWFYGNYGDGSGEPSARVGHTGIFSGERFIIWGGEDEQGNPIGTGAGYEGFFDTWEAVTPVDAPSPRSHHSAVWTGSEMIIWGGVGRDGWLNTGGRFVPDIQAWLPMTTQDAPAPRDGHVAGMIGPYMVVYGGVDGGGPRDDGAVYDPELNKWTPLDLPNPMEPRSRAVGVSTGDALVVWGGEGLNGVFNDGAVLFFDEDGQPLEWVYIPPVGPFSGRMGHTMVYDDEAEAVLIWGGTDGTEYFDDGAIFFPYTGEMYPMGLRNGPQARANHTAVWSGTEMIVHGGEDAGGVFDTIFAYDPYYDTWRQLSDKKATARTRAVAAWVPNPGVFITFGGLDYTYKAIPWVEGVFPDPIYYLYSK